MDYNKSSLAIIFGYNFSPIGNDVAKMFYISKQLSKFAKW